MGGGGPKVDTESQKRSLMLQEEQLRDERLQAQKEREQIASETTQELLARRRGQRGRNSLIATSERGVLSQEDQARIDAFESEKTATKEQQLAALPELEKRRVETRRSLLRAMFSTPRESVLDGSGSYKVGSETGDEALRKTGGSTLTEEDVAYLKGITPRRSVNKGLFGGLSEATQGPRSYSAGHAIMGSIGIKGIF